jgi:hemerythrin-like domain-containing protein
MTPTDLLREEHRVILRALDLLECAAARLDVGDAVADVWWREIVAWLRGFADRTHHAREEAALFPAMVKAGVPSEGGPLAVMLEEHGEGRALVTAIDTTAGAARVAACRDYAALLRAHIDKENEIVFPLAEAVLDALAIEGLRREFDAVDAGAGMAATPTGALSVLARLEATLDGRG